MRFKHLRKTVVSLIAILLLATGAFSQELSEEEEIVWQKANVLFYGEEWTQAKGLFSQLLSLHPKDSEFNYKFGACLVELNEDIPKAIEYLKKGIAPSSGAYVYYFLAKGYHRNYDFDNAIVNYNKFKTMAKSYELVKYQIDNKIEMCKNGKLLLEYVSDLIVIDNKKIKNKNFYYSYDLGDDFSGAILVKPADFQTKVDKRKKDKSLMYVVADKGVNYFSSYGEKGKNGKDIYRMFMQTDGTWGEPQNLGPTINTPFDEEYPFIQNDGKTLFFCSKGHNSMGGYDIFRTTFNNTDMTWSNPVNMDFPTNSPYDDILYVTDTIGDFAFFASNRETSLDQISVYKIEVDKSPKRRPLETMEEIKTKSKLDITPPEEREKLLSKPEIVEPVAVVNESEQPQGQSLTSYELEEMDETEKVSKEEVVSEVKKDIRSLERRIINYEDQAILAQQIADQRKRNAAAKRKNVDKLLEEVEWEKDKEIKAQKEIKAKKLLMEVEDEEQLARVAFDQALDLDETAKTKRQEYEETQTIADRIISSDDKDVGELVGDLNNLKTLINNSDSDYIPPAEKKKQQEKEVGINRRKMETAQEKVEQIEGDMKFIYDDITTAQAQLDDAKKDDKAQYEEVIEQLTSDLEERQADKQAAQKKVDVVKEKYMASSTELEVIKATEKIASLPPEEKKAAIAEAKSSITEEPIAEATGPNSYTEETSSDTDTSIPDFIDDSQPEEIIESEPSYEIEEEVEEITEEETIEEYEEVMEAEEYEEPIAEVIEPETTEEDNYIEEDDTSEPETLPYEEETPVYDDDDYEEIAEVEEYEEITETEDYEEVSSDEYEEVDASDDYEEVIDVEPEPEAYTEYTEPETVAEPVSTAYQEELDDIKDELGIDLTKYEKSEASEVLEDAVESNPSYSFEGGDNNYTQEQKKQKQQEFSANYYGQIADKLSERKTILENDLQETTYPDEKLLIQNEISKIDAIIAVSEEKAAKSKANAEKLDSNVPKSYMSEQVALTQLEVDATGYIPQQEIVTSQEQKEVIKSLEDDREYAKAYFQDLEDNISRVLETQKAIEDALLSEEDPKLKKKLEKERDIELEDAKQNINKYNGQIIVANKKEIAIYKDLTNEKRVVANNADTKLANELEKEAKIYIENADFIRKNAVKSGNILEAAVDMERANNLEKVAINKYVKALDIYTKTEKLIALGEDINTDPVSEETTVTLLAEEEDNLKESRELLFESKSLEKQAQIELTKINEQRDNASSVFDYKVEKDLIKDADERESVANDNLIKAYEKKLQSDSLKYIVYKSQLEQMIKISDDKDTRQVLAQKYYIEAHENYNNNDSLKSLVNKDLTQDKKIEIYEKIISNENLALRNQDIAIEYLVGQGDPTLFISSSDLTNIDRLERLNKPVDVSAIEVADETEILDKLNLDEFESRKIAAAKSEYDKGHKYQEEAQAVYNKIDDLNSKKAAATSSKEKSAIDKEIVVLEVEAKTAQTNADASLKAGGDATYWAFKESFREVRKTDNSDDTRKAKQLEKNADRYFEEAAVLRDKASNEEDQRKAFDLTVEANKLEDKAVNDQKRALSLYLDMATTKGPIAQASSTTPSQDEYETTIPEPETYEEVDSFFDDTEEEEIAEVTTEPEAYEVVEYEVTESEVIEEPIYDEPIAETVVIDDEPATEPVVEPTSYEEVDSYFDEEETMVTEDPAFEVEGFTAEVVELEEDGFDVEGFEAEVIPEPETYEDVDLYFDEPSQEIVQEEVEIEESRAQLYTDVSGLNRTNNVTNFATASPEELVFGVTQSQETNYSKSNPIPTNVVMPDGIVYKVQIGAFTKPIKESAFNGMRPITADKIPGSRFTKYLVGQVESIEAARIILNKTKEIGYNDAFIVAYNNGERVPLYMAKQESATQDQAIAQREVDLLRSKISSSRTSTAVAEASSPTPSKVKSTNVNSFEGLFYTVQVGVFRSPVSRHKLYNLTPIYDERTSNGFIRYSTGRFDDYYEAVSEKDRIRDIGIKDAFVTSYYNGKRLTTVEASRLVLLEGPEVFAPKQGVSIDRSAPPAPRRSVGTQPAAPTPDPFEEKSESYDASKVGENDIIFRIQIGAYQEQVPMDVVSKFLRVASNIGLDQFTTPNGITVFSVGQYNNYKEASDMRLKLATEEGMDDAFIVAFKGYQKISVDEAKQLLGQ